MSRLANRRGDLAALLILLLTTLLYLAPALRPGIVLLPAQLPYHLDPLWQPLAPPGAVATANPILADQFYQYHPWKVATRQAFAQGQLPLWNPWQNGGQPLAANGQVGLLDPFHLIGYLFPLSASYVVGALLRLWVAGGFTYAYARTIGLSWPASVLAMLVFAFSGPITAWLGSPPSHVAVWLPALLWGGEQLLVTRRWRWVIIASVLLALMLLSAQPEIAFQMGIAWGVYLLARASWLEGGLLPGLRHHAGRLLLVATTGLLLAAVEVLPFLAALRHSAIFSRRLTESAINTTGDAGTWLRDLFFTWEQWPTLITTLLPHFLGRESDLSYWLPSGNSVENNAYAGVLPLALAALALIAVWRNREMAVWHWARRWVLLWGGLGLLALAVALGLPLFNGLNLLPPFNLTAGGRYRLVYGLAVAILAGLGLDLLRGHLSTLRRPLLLLLGVGAVGNVLLVAMAYTGFTHFADQLLAAGRAFMQANVGTPYLDQPLEQLYALVETRQAAKLALLTQPVLFIPLLVAGLVTLLFWLHQQHHLRQPLLMGAFIAIAWGDLAWASFGFNSTAPTAWLAPTPPAIGYLQQQPGPFRLIATGLILNPNAAMLYGLQDVRGYDPLAAARYGTLLAALEGFSPSHHHNFFRQVDDPRLDWLNATYALTRQPPAHARWEPVFADPSGVTVYRSHSALPRAWLVYQAEVAATSADALAQVLDPGFDPRQRVVLEQTPLGWDAPPSAPATSSTEFIAYQPNRVQLRVTSATSGLLVLADSYAPGWRATVDGVATPIYVANYAFRALVVPAGEHTVEFVYAPASLQVGAFISLATVVALLLVGLVAWRWHSSQGAA